MSIQENRVSAEDLFRFIFKQKMRHREFARQYIDKPSRVIRLVMLEKYRYVSTFLYNAGNTSISFYAPRTLLASFIVEKYLLYRERGILKNLVVSIVGMGGAGKTTYSVISGIGAFILISRYHGRSVDIEELKSSVSSLIFFEPTPFVDTIHTLIDEGKWIPFIIVDDIGSQISKYWIYLGQHFWVYLFSVIDQAKDWVGNIVMTARNLDAIPSKLREITDIVVEAHEVVTDEGVVADVFEYYRYEDYVSTSSPRNRLKRLLYIDVMPSTVKIPDDIWVEMMRSRRRLGRQRVGMVKEAVTLLPRLERARLESMRKKVEKMEKGEETSDEGV